MFFYLNFFCCSWRLYELLCIYGLARAPNFSNFWQQTENSKFLSSVLRKTVVFHSNRLLCMLVTLKTDNIVPTGNGGAVELYTGHHVDNMQQ